MARTDKAQVQRRYLLQAVLYKLFERAENAVEIDLERYIVTIQRRDFRKQRMILFVIVGTQKIAGKESLVLGNIREHGIRPMQIRGNDEFQGFRAEI